jgi:putative ABC transport system permease protein
MVWLSRWRARAWREGRYAARALGRAPAFCAVAVLTVALGVGANALMFAVLDGILLRPLPYRDATQLVLVDRKQDFTGVHRPQSSFFTLSEGASWSSGLPGVAATGLYVEDADTLNQPSGAEPLPSAIVSGTFFSTLDGPLVAGRSLTRADDSDRVVVVSARLASRLFGNPVAAVGRPLKLSSNTFVIIGVAAPSFQFPTALTDVWKPAGVSLTPDHRCCTFRLVGRLRADATASQVAAQAAALARAESQAPGRDRADVHATVTGLEAHVVATVRPVLVLLSTAVGLILLVACANLMNLLLARQLGRAREGALRLAMGASAFDLAAPAVAEGLQLVSLGSLLGTALAVLGVRLLAHASLPSVPRLDNVQVDWRVMVFSAALAGLVALAVSLVAVAQVRRADTTLGLRAGAATVDRRVARRLLCMAELAISLVLLVGATLLGRSLMRLMATDLGVEVDHVVTLSTNLSNGPRPTDDQTITRLDSVLTRLRAVPGVRTVGLGTSVPPSLSRRRISLLRHGESHDYIASLVSATPEYFDALGMRLLHGRLFTAQDDAYHPPVVVMTADAARGFFGEVDPIGQTVSLPILVNGVRHSGPVTLVGVVGNVRYSGLDAQADDSLYRPFAQEPWIAPYVVARTSVEPEALLPVFRRAIASVDPMIVVSDARTLDDRLSEASAQPRLQTHVLGALAGLAVLMAVVGLYGVVAYSVAQRTKEFGVRMALGADRGRVLMLALGESAQLAAAGVAGGLAAAYGLSRALAGLLYGIAPTDPTAFASAAAALFVVAILSGYLPARRATDVDPLVALRHE